MGLPRWARCPVDRQLHLLAPAQVKAAGVQGPRAGLTINGAPVAGGMNCLTAGTAGKRASETDHTRGE
jgi:hypothetical protein